MKANSLVPAVLAVMVLSAIAAPSGYTIVDLGFSQQPQAINSAGALAGCSLTDRQCNVPERYDGSWTALKTAHPGAAHAINDKGVAVGEDGLHPIRWTGGHRLVLRAGLHIGATAEGIAGNGTIVGTRQVGSGTGCYSWKAGNVTDLGSLGGGLCQAHAIDKSGRYIAGESYVPAGTGVDHAFVRDENGMHDLGLLPGGAYSRAVHVNAHGHASVIADYDNSGDWAAAYWNGRKLIAVPDVTEAGGESFSGGMNDNDMLLVAGYDTDGHFLFLYDGHAGTTTAIEPLIHNPTGWDFNWGLVGAATLTGGIDDDGTIVGGATYNGEEHGFMLVPDAQ